MATMKRILIVSLLLGSTALGGYRVFAGGGSVAVAALQAECTPQECERACGQCPPEACPPDACTPVGCPVKG